MRSSPANASVIWVPIEAIDTSGAATRPMKKMYITKSPSVMRPARMSLPPSHTISTPTDADDHGAAGGGRRDAGHRLGDVAEQPVGAVREDDLFALLGGVALDDADAAERLGEPPGDLGVDLAALAEQRPQRLEGVGHAAAEQAQHDHRDDRQAPVEIEQHAQADRRRHQPADQLHQPGADQIAQPVGVGHDPRHQDAGLRRVEVAHRQPHHLGLHPLAHVGDGALRGHAEDLRQPEGLAACTRVAPPPASAIGSSSRDGPCR